MMNELKLRSRPRAELLEARDVPAVAVAFAGGILSLTGDNQANTLTVTATANNKVQVSNQTGAGPVVNLGTYNLTGDLRIRMGNSADNVALDLGANTLGGSVRVDTGNSGDLIIVGGLAGGKISSSFTALTGSGDDALFIDTIAIGGSMMANTGLGFDAVGLGGGSGNVYGGNVTVMDANGVFSDVPVTIAGNLIVTTNEALNNVFAFGMTVGGSAVFTSGSGNDLLRLNEGGVIAGNLTANLGAGNDSYQQGSGIGPTGTFAVNGSLTVLAGTGNDSLVLGGTGNGATVGGSATLDGGDGDNTYILDTTLAITGNLTVRGGNGVNDLATAAIGATVGGDASFVFGNGGNQITWGATSALAGKMNVTTGSGADVLTLLGGQPYRLNAQFGAGDDTLTLNNAALVLSGYVDFGADTDTLNQTAGIFGDISILNL